MKIKLISVGKLKENYLMQGTAEYVKRLSRFTQFQLFEVADEKTSEKLSTAQMLKVKQKEGERILAKINDNDYVFALAIEGKLYRSPDLAQKINTLGIFGKSQITFVIGGSLGLSEKVFKRSDEKISFGKFTFPHQLMRLILIEQIYRSFMINYGHPYHK
ncbi:MAG: 23S rRNA (pseudouridine(1915)-N(3))-methyltransferase RlmH [Lactobacillales bacterium]|nr:23S rRNA (pseudouridine(1915)-N(3))-methyltransferase RlmH [Lactobacillales bacterium]